MKFLSGSIILDVWNDKKIYIFQFEPHRIGLSEVDENVGFDTIPDKILLQFRYVKTCIGEYCLKHCCFCIVYLLRRQ